MKYTKNKSVACDITQEVFIRLWQQREELDPNQSIRSWLYTSIRNQSLNHIRDHRKEQIGLEMEPALDEPTEGPTTSDRNRLQRLQEWIQQLPERQREAFTLSRFEGLDHDEIAHVMKISAKTVNNHLVQALQTLREKGSESSQQVRTVRHG